MDVAVISTLAGIGGAAIGAFGTAFLLGRRYESLLANDKALFKAYGKLEREVGEVRDNFKVHKEREEGTVTRLEGLITLSTAEMAKLSERVAVLNNTLEGRPQQKDIQDIVERLASIEAKVDRNGKEKAE